MTHIANSCSCCRVAFDPSAFLRALRPEQDAEQVFQKFQSFARRHPSWNPWPRDKESFRLFQSLDRWISDPSCCLLTVRGARASSLSQLPVPENFACHLIHILRETTSFPIFWAISPTEEKSRAKEGVKTLISQALETLSRDFTEKLASNLPFSEDEPSEEKLFQLLHNVLGGLDKCFVLIEVKDSALAERFRHTIQSAMSSPEANFKAVVIAYSALWTGSQDIATENAIMPSIRLRGSKPGWDPCWNRTEPLFK